MSVVTLTEVKADLRVTNDAEDTVIQNIMDGAQSWLEEQYGLSLSEVSITERVDGGGYELEPLRRPIVSVTSVTDKRNNDDVIDTDDYWADDRAIRREDESRWTAGRRRFEVVYTGGYGGSIAAPALLKLGVLRFIARAYRARYTQRFELSAGASINWSSFMESDVIEMLGPFRRVGV